MGKEIIALQAMLKNITSLDVSDCDLVQLPHECGNLNLNHLNISRNKFNRVPSCLYGGLKKLEILDLSYNNISDFDIEPDCILSLKIINLGHNLFKNIPKWFLIFKAINLQEFSYNNNKAKHYNYFKNCYASGRNKLLKLELIQSQLLDCDYSFLRQFKHLKYLDIGNDGFVNSNRFGEFDKLFSEFHWKQLKILKVSHLDIVVFPAGIFWLDSLSELYFNGNFASWIPEDIKYMINLEVLEISHNHLVSLPNGLIELKQLRVIKAAYNGIETVPDLTRLEKLNVLDLYGNLLDEISINVTKLEFLDLENNYINTRNFDSELKYDGKKNNYRKTILESRFDGFKTFDVVNEDSEEDDRDLECYGQYQPSEVTQGSALLEDWELEIIQEHQPSVYVDSDDDWKGEEEVVKKTHVTRLYTEMISIPDEDWMFEDAFENS